MPEEGPAPVPTARPEDQLTLTPSRAHEEIQSAWVAARAARAAFDRITAAVASFAATARTHPASIDAAAATYAQTVAEFRSALAATSAASARAEQAVNDVAAAAAAAATAASRASSGDAAVATGSGSDEEQAKSLARQIHATASALRQAQHVEQQKLAEVMEARNQQSGLMTELLRLNDAMCVLVANKSAFKRTLAEGR